MMTRTTLLVAAALALPSLAAAQGPRSVLYASDRSFPEWSVPAPVRPVLRPVAMSGGSDHTVLGLVIGAAVGLVAGYAFYDVMCEAVDNNCADSRFTSLVVGAGAGGALGALIGSLAD